MSDQPCGRCRSCAGGRTFTCATYAPIEAVLNEHLGVVSSGKAVARRANLARAIRAMALTAPEFERH